MIFQRRGIDVQTECSIAHGLRAGRDTAAAPEEFQEDQRLQAYGSAQACGKLLAQVDADVPAPDQVRHAVGLFRLRPALDVAPAFWPVRKGDLTLAGTWSKSGPITPCSPSAAKWPAPS